MGAWTERIYCHIELDNGEWFTRAVDVGLSTSFGQIKRSFMSECRNNDIISATDQSHAQHYQFYTRRDIGVPDLSVAGAWVAVASNTEPDKTDKQSAATDIPVVAGGYDLLEKDFILLPKKEQSLAGEKGELSYYYTHTQKAEDLEKYKPTTVSQQYVKEAHNKKQSPFGTNIELYETITKYSFSDTDGWTVKVDVPIPNALAELDKEKVKSQFAERAFELTIEDYRGKKLRLGCSRTHERMDFDKCKHIIKKDKIVLVIRKAKQGDIWFDLFKKKAIGDDDP